MKPVALSANGLMAHAVREAVDSVAAPDRREAVISLALRWSKLSEIPEAGPDVADFIENSLHRAAEEVLGTESANMIVEQLRPIAEMVGAEEVSEIRRSYPELAAFTEEPDDRPISKVSLSTRPPALDLEFELDGDDGADFELGFDFEEPADDDDPVIIVLDEDGNEEEEESVLQTGRVAVTHRPAARNTLAPFVLVSSADPTRLSSINSALGSAATVEVVSDALAVLQGLTDDRARLLVVDCARPTVRLETLLALTPELPESTRIVLWGEPRDLALRLLGGGELPTNWVCAGDAAGPEDIGAICRVLLT